MPTTLSYHSIEAFFHCEPQRAFTVGGTTQWVGARPRYRRILLRSCAAEVCMLPAMAGDAPAPFAHDMPDAFAVFCSQTRLAALKKH